jgi:glycosyltransferase involved in cell wall biosynthesis
VTPGPRILALIGDRSGCTLWRVWQPFAEVQRHGVFAHWIDRASAEFSQTNLLQKLPANFDAVLLPRVYFHQRAEAVHFVDRFHGVGLDVFVEVDDDIYSPAIVERAYATQDSEHAKGLAQLEAERQARIDVLKLCDGVTVSSRRLATIVSAHTDAPVEVVPNAIDTRWFRQILHGAPRLIPPLTIGWAGGARYGEDLAAVAEAWRNIARRYPEVTFVVQGHMADILVEAIPADRCRRVPWLPLEYYPRALRNIDIGCASVAPKLFNTAKTPIKVWEYACAGIPTVASPTLYGPVITDGEDGLLAETAAEWEAALARLIEDPALRQTLWRAQRRRIALTHSLEQNWHRWPNAWTRLLNRPSRPLLATG